MTPRFRIVAGPNGSGKSTLMRRLAADYAVNFYSVVNADDIFAEVSRTGAYAPSVSVTAGQLKSYAEATSYPDAVKAPFRDGTITVEADCVRFRSRESATSYTVSLLAGFLQEMHIMQRASFSQETVFSHPSKVDGLKAARDAGFKTYLYFVATDSPQVNSARVEARARLGGHSVPAEKVVGRYGRCFDNAIAAIPFLSRAFFFDNGEEEMRYLGEWNHDDGFVAARRAAGAPPRWFGRVRAALPQAYAPCWDRLGEEGERLAASAASASRDAVASAFAAGLSVTVIRGGRIVRVSPDGTETPVEKGEP